VIELLYESAIAEAWVWSLAGRWDLSWAKWQCAMFFSEYFVFRLLISFQQCLTLWRLTTYINVVPHN